MKIEIKTEMTKTEIIDVEFPCFYKKVYEFMGEESTTYIMLTEEKKYVFEKTILDEEEEIEWLCSTADRCGSSDHLFINPNIKSDKQEFLSAKLEALQFLEQVGKQVLTDKGFLL